MEIGPGERVTGLVISDTGRGELLRELTALLAPPEPVPEPAPVPEPVSRTWTLPEPAPEPVPVPEPVPSAPLSERTCCPTLPGTAHTGTCFVNSVMRSGEERFQVNDPPAPTAPGPVLKPLPAPAPTVPGPVEPSPASSAWFTPGPDDRTRAYQRDPGPLPSFTPAPEPDDIIGGLRAVPGHAARHAGAPQPWRHAWLFFTVLAVASLAIAAVVLAVAHDLPFSRALPRAAAPAPSPAAAAHSGTASLLADVPGVPRSFAACAAASGTAGGNVYGIPASAYNVAGDSVAQQKVVFSLLYRKLGGPSLWPGCK